MAYGTGQNAQGDGAIAADHKRPRLALKSDVHLVSNPPDGLSDAIEVSLPRTGFVRSVQRHREITSIKHVDAGRL